MMRIENLVADCRTAQIDYYGTDPASVAGVDRKRYLTAKVAGLATEVGELSQELDWPMWKDRDEFDHDISMEAADVLIFLGNILAATGVSDEILQTALDVKDRRNRRRAIGRADA